MCRARSIDSSRITGAEEVSLFSEGEEVLTSHKNATVSTSAAGEFRLKRAKADNYILDERMSYCWVLQLQFEA
jgi:hypothetical protein